MCVCTLFVFATQFQDEGAFYYSHLACLDSVIYTSRPGLALKSHLLLLMPVSRNSRRGATQRPTVTDPQGLDPDRNSRWGYQARSRTPAARRHRPPRVPEEHAPSALPRSQGPGGGGGGGGERTPMLPSPTAAAALYPLPAGTPQGAWGSPQPHGLLLLLLSRCSRSQATGTAEQSATKHNGGHPSGCGAQVAAAVGSPALPPPPPPCALSPARFSRDWRRCGVAGSCGRARRAPPRGGALTAAAVEGRFGGSCQAPR